MEKLQSRLDVTQSSSWFPEAWRKSLPLADGNILCPPIVFECHGNRGIQTPVLTATSIFIKLVPCDWFHLHLASVISFMLVTWFDGLHLMYSSCMSLSQTYEKSNKRPKFGSVFTFLYFSWSVKYIFLLLLIYFLFFWFCWIWSIIFIKSRLISLSSHSKSTYWIFLFFLFILGLLLPFLSRMDHNSVFFPTFFSQKSRSVPYIGLAVLKLIILAVLLSCVAF